MLSMRVEHLYNNAGNARLIDLLMMREAGMLLPEEEAELDALLETPDGPGIQRMYHTEKEYLQPVIEAPVFTGKVRRLPVLRYMAGAAAVLLIAGSIYYFSEHTAERPVVAGGKPAFKTDVAPGANKAVLTLANGRQILLDDAGKGNLAREGATDIMKLSNGELAYKAGETEANREIAYNTIATPRAGQYMVGLPDGSKVWLNAASSIRFPVAFKGKDRVVEMTGEAYFEIAANARQPFKVKTGKQEIQVLGTNFNISAYAEDKTVNTTLLEGSVRVTNGEDAQYLNPGQQAQADEAHIALVKKPDLEEVMAWKNGVFRFNESSIEVIMKQLSRWYDVEVVYENNKQPSTRFVGTIPRNVPLSEVLHLLELTGHIQFSIENSRKILVRY